jgi:hypothetical protein
MIGSSEWRTEKWNKHLSVILIVGYPLRDEQTGWSKGSMRYGYWPITAPFIEVNNNPSLKPSNNILKFSIVNLRWYSNVTAVI